jgi:DNA mismatch endonuclease, patch repair protein
MKVRSMVHRMGYRYRLHRKELPGKPDLVFPGKRKVIFVHGCFFHMHNCRYGTVIPKSNAEFWHKKRLGNVERDRKNTEALRRDGWDILEVWECQTKKEEGLSSLAGTISEFLSA